jgi:tetratricopeptide (TPR) repeat protein
MRESEQTSTQKFGWLKRFFPAALVVQVAMLSTNSFSQDRGFRQQPAQSVGSADWQKRTDYALLFATNEYDSWQSLINPVPDALAIAKELEDNYGFKTEVVRNPTRERILIKLREYSQKPFGKGDQLFIFFAGHGIYDDVFHQGYIVAKDSRQNDETRGSYESYDDLAKIVDKMGFRHIMLVVDACFSGTFDRRIGESATRGGGGYAGFSFPELFTNKAGLVTRKYLTSGGKEYVPDGDAGHHSPFAASLLNGLRSYGGPQGYLTSAGIQASLEQTKPQPFAGDWGDNEPGSEFFFVSKQFSAKLAMPTIPGSAGLQPDQSRGAGDGTKRTRPAVAVLGFKNVAGRADVEWLSVAFSEGLTTELTAGEKIRAIRSENVSRAKEDLGLQDSSAYSEENLTKLSKALDARYIVSGSYTVVPGGAQGVRIDLRLQDATTGDMIGQAAEDGTMANLSDLIRRSGTQLRTKLGIGSPSEPDAKAVQASLPGAAAAAKPYAEGLVKLRGYDLMNARDLLERAVQFDPKFAPAHLALAQTQLELGYDNKAKIEAATAVDLSTDLPSEKRSLIEANYLQMTAEWDRAGAIYSALWTLQPDEIDYGLELATVQIAAGHTMDALSTLDKLRGSSAQAAEDPRIYFQEAIAAANLPDVKRQAAASEKSAGLAAARGARLLEAQARWQRCTALTKLGETRDAGSECLRANQLADVSGGNLVKARSLTALANLSRKQGKNSEAMEWHQQALQIARQIGSHIDMIGALENLANLESALGQLDNAQSKYKEAAALAREIGNAQQLSSVQIAAANLLYERGDYQQALQAYEESRSSARQARNLIFLAMASKNVAVLAYELGHMQDAEKSIREAIQVATESNLRPLASSGQNTLGDILAASGDLNAAAQAYQSALDSASSRKDEKIVAISRTGLASIALERGDAGKAEELARLAAAEFQREKTPEEEASARELLARALSAQSKLTEARQELEIAKLLPVEDLIVRIEVATTAAQVAAREGNSNEARTLLADFLANATQKGLIRAQLEIRLAQAAMEARANKSNANELFQAVERDALEKGYLHLAARAKSAF